nr:cytochrome P450 3044A1/2 [Brachionus rubens]
MDLISKFEIPIGLKEYIGDIWDEALKNKGRSSLILGGTLSVVIILNYLKNWWKLRSTFKRLNIPGPSPLPLMGNLLGVLKQGFAKHDEDIVKKYGKTLGYFEGSTPVVLTTDIKFIKNVMIKDFNYFVNRRTFDSLLIEPIDKFITVLKDDEWKNVRAIITTTFTSGKLKSMSRYMNDCVGNMENFISTLADSDGILDTKTLFSGFTLDVISTCCFGVSTNSINDPNTEILYHAQQIFKNSISFDPKILLIFFFPEFSGYLSRKKMIEFFPNKSLQFFENFTNEVIKRRKNKLEKRDDFIQNILEHEVTSDSDETKPKETDHEHLDGEKLYKWNSSLKKTLTNKEILSQSILFLLAGYETTAQTLCFISYNLAMNPNYQTQLCEEVDSVLDKHDGKINYESVNEMTFMEKVIDETLRMFPPAMRLDRIASDDYEYNGMKIEKGMIWSVPIWALHHDPEIYPEPNVFRPERFDENEKKLRDNVAYLPFGAGPRNCVGMRFALLEIKLLLAAILSKYRFEKCDKTPEKIEIDNSGFARPTKPIFVKVSRR